MAATCQFANSSELATGNRQPDAYSTREDFGAYQMKRQLKLPIQPVAYGCRLPFAFLAFIVLSIHESNWHPAVS